MHTQKPKLLGSDLSKDRHVIILEYSDELIKTLGVSQKRQKLYP